MATYSKEELRERLRKLNVEAPPDASSQDLQKLYKQVKSLPVVAPGGDRVAKETAVSSPAVPPPMRPAAPLASVGVAANIGPVTSSPSPLFGSGRTETRPSTPAVPVPPPPMSDHEARPWDPHAGW